MQIHANAVALIVLTFSISIQPLFAMGSKRPSTGSSSGSSGTGTTTPTPTTPDSLKPTLDLGDRLDGQEYLNISAEIGAAVDDARGNTALMKRRSSVNTDQVDKCFSDDNDHELFADQISYYVSELLNDTPAMVGVIGSYYGTSSSDNNYFPTSLIRHPLCTSTTSSLGSTINKVPAQSVINKLNAFTNEVNDLRKAVLQGDMKAKADLGKTWTRFFSCLAYTESLGSADSSASNAVAKKVAPSGYRKPAGVEFYEDPSQDASSRLNIGMFQFTPNAGGNIQSCLRAWNVLHAKKSSCLVPEKGSQADMIKILGSSLQSFNAFCGVHKLIQTFAIQVNTTKTSATHPSNLVNGKLKNHELRCVTPHFQSGRAYNHFGPFQNSTGTNLNSLFSCIENSR